MLSQSQFQGFLRRTLFGLMLFVGCANANAVKWVPIQLEQEIEVKPFQDAFYTITPEESGIMKLVTVSGAGTNGYAVTTTGGTVTDGSVETVWSWATDGEPSYLSFAVTSGRTYYISLNFPMDAWSFKATMSSADFYFTGSIPADGETYYITSHETVYLHFTSNSVTFKDGELTVNDKVVKVYNYKDYNDLVAKGIFTYTEVGTSGVVNWNGALCAREENGIAMSFTTATGYDFYNVINRLFERGLVNENDPIKLAFHGVKDNLTGALLNGDGNIEVTWYFGGAPTSLTDAKMPQVIKSWFNEGDPEAIATFNFSNAIKSARASLEMGQGEGADDYYIEEIAPDKIIYDGNSVKVDLSGVMRTNKTMGLNYNWPSFTLTLYSVVDIDGNSTFSESLGSASSYSYVINYVNISADMASEFTPRSGSTLTDKTKEIEIWFNNSDVIEWDGVEFVYYTMEDVEDVDHEGNPVMTEQNVAHDTFIPRAELDVELEGNETTIMVPVPDGIYKANNIRLGVNVTKSVDGNEHVIAAYYNTSLSHDLDLLPYASPASGSTLSVLSEIYLTLGSTYAINSKLSQPVRVYGENTGKVVGGRIVEDGMTNAKVVLDEILTDADTYVVEIAAGAIGDYIYGESLYQTGITNEKCTLTYVVDGKYENKTVGVAPEEGEVSSLDSFALTFFLYASVAPTWNVEAYVEDAEGKKSPGQFAESTGEVTNSLTFTLVNPITAAGEYRLVIPSGAVCNGATGEPITTEYSFSYTVKPDVVVPERPVVDPAEGEVEKIEAIGLQFEINVTPNPDSFATLEIAEDGTWNAISGTLTQGLVPNVLVFTPYEPVTKGGDYTFTIDLDNVLGEDGQPLAGVFEYHYTVKGSGPVIPEGGDPTIVPEEGEVESLGSFVVTFNGYNSWGNTDFKFPTLTDEKGTTYTCWDGLSIFTPDDTMLPWNAASIVFEETVEASGEYVLTVPVVLYDDNWNSVEKSFEFRYVILNDVKVEAGRILGTDGRADVYTLGGKLLMKHADAADLKTLKPGFYVVGGTIVRLK